MRTIMVPLSLLEEVHMLLLIIIPEVLSLKVLDILLIGCFWKRTLSSSSCVTMKKLAVLLAKVVL